MKILLLHCINHSMYGMRDPKQYGTVTLDEINARTQAVADELGVELETFCTNFEGECVEKIHEAIKAHYDDTKENTDAILINPGAWTHYSWGIHDALEMFADDCGPVYELHMSNVSKRESFRQVSVVSDLATGILTGLGVDAYTLGVRAAYDHLMGYDV